MRVEIIDGSSGAGTGCQQSQVPCCSQTMSSMPGLQSVVPGHEITVILIVLCSATGVTCTIDEVEKPC